MKKLPKFRNGDRSVISVLRTDVDCKLRRCSNLPLRVSITTVGYGLLIVHVRGITNQETAVRVTELDNCPVLAARLQVQISSDHVVDSTSVGLLVEFLPGTLPRKKETKKSYRKQQIASKKRVLYFVFLGNNTRRFMPMCIPHTYIHTC